MRCTAMRAPVLSLKGRALRFLSMREHSRLELKRKLARHAEEGDDLGHRDHRVDDVAVLGQLADPDRLPDLRPAAET